MTQAVTWGIKSASFTPAGGSLVNITDLTDIRFRDSINLQELLTDNNTNVNLIFGTGGKTELTLTSSDTSLAWGTTTPPGTAGSLVLVFGKRAAGKGYVSAADKTLTAANAVIGERTGAAATAAAGSVEFNFTAFDVGSGLFSVA